MGSVNKNVSDAKNGVDSHFVCAKGRHKRCQAFGMIQRMKKLTVASHFFWITVVMSAVFLLSDYSSSLARSYQDGYGNCFYILRFLRWEFYNLTSDITLPAVLGIPYICWIYEEIAGKRYYFTAVRERKKDIYAGKIVLYAVLSGMAAAAAALMLSFLISAGHAGILLKGDMTFGYMDMNSEGEISPFYANLVLNGYGWVTVLMRCLSFLCYGGLWPLIGAVAVVWLKNRYVSAVMPFMVNLILEFCCKVELFQPRNMMASVWLEKTKGGGMFCLAALFIGYCGIGYLLIRGGIERFMK